jgi:ankyrin repeat protein
MNERIRKRVDVLVDELLLAVHSGSEDEVRRLLAAGADINGTDAEGMTPLMASAMNGHLEIARLLLASGASRVRVNTWGLSARDIAAWHGHEALAVLLDGGGELSEKAAGARERNAEP